jgi:hypothetical protein
MKTLRRRSFVGHLPLALGAALLALGLAAPSARAQVIYELEPTAGAGATQTVYGAGEAPALGMDRLTSPFTSAGGAGRLHYKGARASHALGARLLYTEYFVAGSPSMLTANLAWMTELNLGALTTLRLGAGGTLTRTSADAFADPQALMLQGLPPGAAYYASTNADVDLAYQPVPIKGYGGTFAVNQLRYIDAPAVMGGVLLPTTTALSLALRANRVSGRETFSVEAMATDVYTDVGAAALAASYIPGHAFVGRALLGWGHEFSPVWSTLLQAGPAVIFRLDGTGVLAPAGVATIGYRRVPWYASLTAMQTPAPNLFLGGAMLTDQVVARVALPLTKREEVFIGGYGGYLYSRVADANGELQRSYDQFTGGLSLYGRIPRLPLTAAITYVALTQRGSALVNYAVSDLARQSLFVSVTGALAWGPGTPPLFGGPL